MFDEEDDDICDEHVSGLRDGRLVIRCFCAVVAADGADQRQG